MLSFYSMFQLFSAALEIIEVLEADLDDLDQWIKTVNVELRKESVELPENPEPEIERIKVTIDSRIFSTENFSQG